MLSAFAHMLTGEQPHAVDLDHRAKALSNLVLGRRGLEDVRIALGDALNQLERTDEDDKRIEQVRAETALHCALMCLSFAMRRFDGESD